MDGSLGLHFHFAALLRASTFEQWTVDADGHRLQMVPSLFIYSFARKIVQSGDQSHVLSRMHPRRKPSLRKMHSPACLPFANRGRISKRLSVYFGPIQPASSAGRWLCGLCRLWHSQFGELHFWCFQLGKQCSAMNREAGKRARESGEEPARFRENEMHKNSYDPYDAH